MEPHVHELDGLPRPDWAPVEEATETSNVATPVPAWTGAGRWSGSCTGLARLPMRRAAHWSGHVHDPIRWPSR